MKKCIKSNPEPTCLAEFRINNHSGTWEQFRSDPDAYRLLRDTTRRDQGGLCAYCEIKLEQDNEQIAHFHPKSDAAGSHNWALDWLNLWLSCKGGSVSWLAHPHHFREPLPDNLSCDAYQGNTILDDIVFAPHELPAFPRIFRFEQRPDRIEICVDIPGCQQAGIDPDRVKNTIEQFNLNCYRLANARLALHRQLEKALKRLRESNIDPRQGLAALTRKHLARTTDGYWPQFFTLVRWRFGQASEEYLATIGYKG